ncbi:Cache sensor-containing two-component system histidine kinase [Campylobacter blaseri]|uniref:Histidine kinase n=1 Tax=Campylobacter blaseri TaxID=2042961 RepID=A0A2P8R3Q6_9BACT|nr:sensor histidine kinase [Campylobacter blaseri]PSM53115.1 histidine kinase [Campylobacter blaseri]PSM54581.1 histidine kinase [Campylobacter blaseri]QKF86946.1 Cache sensor-containing two-component system histidine kinase [Campylobacter blaseri]
MKIISEYNFKFYIAIVLFSIFIIAFGINIYSNAKNQIVNILDKDKITTSQNIVEMFQFWIDEKILSLISASKLIENEDILEDDGKIKKFMRTFLDASTNFDLVQLLTEDGKVYINGNPYHDKSPEANFNLIWYLDTKATKKPTVNFMPNHKILKEETLNLCVPSYRNKEFVAVFCGVVKVKSIFDKVSDFKLLPNSYSFIVTHSGEVLTQMKDEKLKNKIQKKFKEIFLIDEDITSMTIGSNYISIAEIPSLSWFIGAGTDDTKELDKFFKNVAKDGFILLFLFILLAFMANLMHNLMYKRVKKRKDEYEILLTHRTKMAEAGELISGINHQFIQPVNSLNLMISTLLMLKKENRLSEDMLENMLEKGEKSISLLSSTIEIFRNFYKTSENIQDFSIRECILNLITLMHTELSGVNVQVVLSDFEDKNVYQIENIVQQILLILIHNSKDALVEKFKDDIQKRKITIFVRFDDEKCYIQISEFGVGISDAMSRKIFSQPKTTKEFGNGIGLYFGKRLANSKISGDIRLLNSVNPTIFELSFDRKLKDKKDE